MRSLAGHTYRRRVEIADMTVHRRTDTEWAKTLYNALKNEVEQVPKGWLTSDEVAKEMVVS